MQRDMGIMLSVATSADGYMDDKNIGRLILSTPEDWEEIYELRTVADAIVIGAETLRRDNPSLSLKSYKQCAWRFAQGMPRQPYKVVISSNGPIESSLRLFKFRLNDIIVFSTIARPSLAKVAEVIVAEQITPEFIIAELEKRSLRNIFVEGGATIHQMFLASGCVDRLRIAVNPTLRVCDSEAPHFMRPTWLSKVPPARSNLGGMLIEDYDLRGVTQTANEQYMAREIELSRNCRPSETSCGVGAEIVTATDEQYMARAIELSRNCRPTTTSYCVGAVIVTAAGELFEGYTHETSPTHHAEQEAILKAEAAGANLVGATIYSSMEPCSTRMSEPKSCSEIIIEHKFARALFALYEPNCFVECKGALNMRQSGIEVICMHNFGAAVLEVNSHLGITR